MRGTVGPLLLILLTLPFPALLVYTCTHFGGSGAALLLALTSNLTGTLRASYVPLTGRALAALFVHSAWQLALMRLVPGRAFTGPVTPSGHVPKYVDNGVASFLLTLICFGGLSTWGIGKSLPAALHFSPTIFYDEYASLISFLPILAFVLCLGLLVKGLTCPSTREAGSSGLPLVDLYWGTELYPRIFGFDVKQFTNCRHGLMLWALIPLSFAAHVYEVHGSLTSAMAVNVALQVIYVFKFFYWEAGYMASMDIAHDRAGYMIAWGCLAFVPSMYISHSWYLVTATDRAPAAALPDVPPVLAAALFAVGVFAIYANYDADRQRMEVRAKYPSVTVWGAKPVVVKAPYTTEAGVKKQNILLASGWWGVASHSHYLTELLAAAAWSAPAYFAAAAGSVPWWYLSFLTILLLDRAYRDDARCLSKYGPAWVEYRRLVPYKILPGVV